MQLFGSSGIRRLVDRDLISLGLQVGLAVGSQYKNTVIARDTRTSGPALEKAVISGLLAACAAVTDTGIVPTPTLAFIGREYDAGIMITASHNPPEYNGIKLWNPDGSAFDPVQQHRIEELISADELPSAAWSEMKSSGRRDDAVSVHIGRILEDFPTGTGIRVVVDCGCGAGSVITPFLLQKMACDVIAIDSYPSGYFPRSIEPSEANLGRLMQAVVQYNAALGIAHDGDADRVMAVDERGRFIPGDKLMMIFARALKSKEIVTTVDASMAVEEAGLKTRRTRVGDSFVSEELKKGGGDFGGEASGAWIFPRVSLCPDGVYAAAAISEIASRSRISEMVDAITAYPLMRGSVPSDGLTLSAIENGLCKTKPESVSRVDGLRLSFQDGWLLVRPSGTEPKIRLTVEARSAPLAQKIYEQALKSIEACREVSNKS